MSRRCRLGECQNLGLTLEHRPLSRLALTREKIYKTVARQMHGVVPCWVCGQHVPHDTATLEHIQPLSQGGNSHLENLAISHEHCNNQRHASRAA